MPKRIQSPSSINTYKQCPRKYYYQYILKLPTKTNIHLVRGKAIHSVLEHFFKINVDYVSEENYEFELKIVLLSLLDKFWNSSGKQFAGLGLSAKEIRGFYDESRVMVLNWYSMFLGKLKKEMKGKDFVEAFQKLTPKTEQEFLSEQFMVRGFIDAIHDFENEVHLIDYKTSKDSVIKEGYKTQLAIYALLYYEKHNKLPNKVGICFLKHNEKFINVDEELLDLAKQECKLIQENTKSDKIADYQKKESGLCRWHTGQCDFYNECIR